MEDKDVAHALAEAIGNIQSAINQLGIEPPNEALYRSAALTKIEVIRRMRRFTQMRDRQFGPDLFSDTGWHILLDLYYNRLRHRNMTVTDACMASGASYSTGLRWINLLIDRGLVRRDPDPRDARVSFVRLSANGIAAMDSLFSDYA